jgi:hypothetical protein
MSNEALSSASSRRGFTKRILGLIAAIPFLSSLVSGTEEGLASSVNELQRSVAKGPQDRPGMETHNTPPPLSFDEGSFTIDSKHQLALTTLQTPFMYSSTFGGTPNLAHIRILDGQGREKYYEPHARGATIKMRLEDEDGVFLDEINVSGGTAIKITSQTMRLNERPNEKPKALRKHRCEHPGRPNKGFRVSRITVANAPHTIDLQASAHPDYFSEEYRVMIWLD